MFSSDVQVRCPVGGNILGTRSTKVPCAFLCKDCGWIFTWDSKGKLLPPTKYETKKEPQECGCGCGR